MLESFGRHRVFWSNLETNLDRLEAALDPAYFPTLAPDPSPTLAPDPDLPLSIPLPILSPYFAWDSKIPLPLPIPDKKLFCPLSGHFP